jgi:hypothetical protein
VLQAGGDNLFSPPVQKSMVKIGIFTADILPLHAKPAVKIDMEPAVKIDVQ